MPEVEVRIRYAVFFFQAKDGIRDYKVTGVQTCALPISPPPIGLYPDRRRREGRLPRRVVPRQQPHAEPQLACRCAQPLHREARLAPAALPRALDRKSVV